MGGRQPGREESQPLGEGCNWPAASFRGGRAGGRGRTIDIGAGSAARARRPQAQGKLWGLLMEEGRLVPSARRLPA